MKQRTSFTLTVKIDIIQDLPDTSSQRDVINDLASTQLTLERNVVTTLLSDYGNSAKVEVIKLPYWN